LIGHKAECPLLKLNYQHYFVYIYIYSQPMWPKDDLPWKRSHALKNTQSIKILEHLFHTAQAIKTYRYAFDFIKTAICKAL